jgi:hypothetical protein
MAHAMAFRQKLPREDALQGGDLHPTDGLVRYAKGPRYLSKRLNACAEPSNGFLSLIGSSSALLRPHYRQYGELASRLLCKMSADVEGLTSYQPAEANIVSSRKR